MASRYHLAVLALCCLASLVAAQVTYEQLKPTGEQWTISIATTSTPDKAAFVPVTACNQTAVSAACLQPLLTADNQDKVQFTFKAAGSQLKTLDDLPVLSLMFQACYSKSSTADRPWRKPAPVVTLDKSCPFVLQVATPTPDNSYTVTWPVPKNATKASWYAQVLTICQNGTGTTYCGAGSTQNANYFATNTINSTPVSMQIATAICAAIGPLFLASYFVKDYVVPKRK